MRILDLGIGRDILSASNYGHFTFGSQNSLCCTPSIRVRMGQSASLDMRVLRKINLHVYQITTVIPSAIALRTELTKFRRSVQLRDAQCPSVRNALCL